MLMVMESIHFVVSLIEFFGEVVACLNCDVILFEEIMFLEDLVYHEGETCFLKYLAENEYIKLNLIYVKVI